MSEYSFIHTEKALHPVTVLCRVCGVTRSAYYEWLAKGPSCQKRSDKALTETIREIFVEGRENYGSPRVLDELKKRGVAISRKRVARLMREAGLKAKTRRKFKATTDSTHGKLVDPNLLNQSFDVLAPNVAWVSDITYIRTREGWMYLATVIDLYSRRVVGWSLRPRMAAALVCNAFDMAVRLRKPPSGLIFHSDRGSQYASKKLRKRLAQRGMQQSMSGTGNCYDNAVAESFFATLKKELVRGKTFSSHDHARRAVFEYIEVFYNRKRKHSKASGISPVAFEACFTQLIAA